MVPSQNDHKKPDFTKEILSRRAPIQRPGLLINESVAIPPDFVIKTGICL